VNGAQVRVPPPLSDTAAFSQLVKCCLFVTSALCIVFKQSTSSVVGRFERPVVLFARLRSRLAVVDGLAEPASRRDERHVGDVRLRALLLKQ